MLNISSKLILSILILPMLAVISSAELEQKLISINNKDKQVTITLFHFEHPLHKASILPVGTTLGQTIAKVNGKAGITISNQTGVTIQHNQISFSPKANFLIKDGVNVPREKSNTFSKHTFILTNGKGNYILGYTPATSQTELSYAIQQYLKSNKFNYNTAVLIGSGNSCAFYKDNGEYHEYYLKELNPAKHLIMVK